MKRVETPFIRDLCCGCHCVGTTGMVEVNYTAHVVGIKEMIAPLIALIHYCNNSGFH